MKTIKIATLAALVLTVGLAGCSTLKPLDPQRVSVDPQPLVLKGGKVPVTITVRFPNKWFNKKAEVRVTPILKYPGGESWGTAYALQGEKVRGNAQTISYAGQSVVLNSDFEWKPEMRNAELYLKFNAKVNGKEVRLPDLKIGEGTIATEALADVAYAVPALAPDNFQRIIKKQYDANIQFLIQQANLRGTELSKSEISNWKDLVQNAYQIPNQDVDVEVQAYASPDGGVELNDKLAQSREKNTTQYLQRELNRLRVEKDVAAHYTAQDWEGFRKLVEQSNLQDKELVLRVLEMYPDPEVREREIKNISSVFSDLADVILPQLRRSRLVANVTIVGKSDEDILRYLRERPGRLTVDELLYAATLSDDPAVKLNAYQQASGIYPKDYRAWNNLGLLRYLAGDIDGAASYFDKATNAATAAGVEAPEVALNKGLIALKDGDVRNAQTLIGQATKVPEYEGVMGLLAISEGRYADAAKALRDVPTNNGVLAQILNKDYNHALELLGKISTPDATTAYLKAIIGARTAQESLVREGIREAVALDPSLKSTIAQDKELGRYTISSDIKSLLM